MTEQALTAQPAEGEAARGSREDWARADLVVDTRGRVLKDRSGAAPVVHVVTVEGEDARGVGMLHAAIGDLGAILDHLAPGRERFPNGVDLELVRRRARRGRERIEVALRDAPAAPALEAATVEQLTATRSELARVREQRDRALDLADAIVGHAEGPGLTSGVLADMRHDVDRARRVARLADGGA